MGVWGSWELGRGFGFWGRRIGFSLGFLIFGFVIVSILFLCKIGIVKVDLEDLCK